MQQNQEKVQLKLNAMIFLHFNIKPSVCQMLLWAFLMKEVDHWAAESNKAATQLKMMLNDQTSSLSTTSTFLQGWQLEPKGSCTRVSPWAWAWVFTLYRWGAGLHWKRPHLASTFYFLCLYFKYFFILLWCVCFLISYFWLLFALMMILRIKSTCIGDICELL